jgi:hypothetical protein
LKTILNLINYSKFKKKLQQREQGWNWKNPLIS